MASEFRYHLDRSSKKYRCPMCKQKTFVLYIDNETNGLVDAEVGRCDRQNNCCHHFTPKEYFEQHPEKKPEGTRMNENRYQDELPEVKLVSYYPLELAEKTFNKVFYTNFYRFIADRFGARAAGQALLMYMAGKSNNDNGTAIIFWEWDIDQNIRSGKVMCYDPVTGKRRKEDHYKPYKLHKNIPDFNYQGCFFGEHLLGESPDKKVVIVESEKTAIIGSIVFPEYNWLATGGASGCKWREYSVYKVLEGKSVTMYPDYGMYNKATSKTCYHEWSERAQRITEAVKCDIRISDLLERQAKLNREEDTDLIDILLNTNKIIA